MASLLTIAEVAERTGLSAHTLRYYERAGLIAPVARAPGGQRRYAASDLDWIGFLLRLRGEGNGTAAQRRELLEQHLAQVLASIATLRGAAKALQAKIGHYQGLEQEQQAGLRRASPSKASPTKGKPDEHRSRSTLPPRPGQVEGDRRRSR